MNLLFPSSYHVLCVCAGKVAHPHATNLYFWSQVQRETKEREMVTLACELRALYCILPDCGKSPVRLPGAIENSLGQSEVQSALPEWAIKI